jgi:hypothetical protein
MPQLTFPLATAGMVVDCRLNVDATTMRAAVAAGTVPTSVPTQGELPAGLPFDVLVGLDVLRNGKLFLDGPAGQFTLDA